MLNGEVVEMVKVEDVWMGYGYNVKVKLEDGREGRLMVVGYVGDKVSVGNKVKVVDDFVFDWGIKN